MTQAPRSPGARRLASPGWLDARLLLGVLLVLVSVVVGARLLSAADRSQLVWTTTRDLAAGTSLADGDLEATRARLFGSGQRYLTASGPKPVGYVIERGLGAGELLPVQALRRPEVDVDFRYVTVPAAVGHLPPDLDRGQHVDVWVTPARDAVAAGTQTPGEARRVLSAVPVSRPPDTAGFGGGTEQAVVLQVRPGDVGPLVSAMSEGRLDLVRVPRAAEAPAGLTVAVEAG